MIKIRIGSSCFNKGEYEKEIEVVTMTALIAPELWETTEAILRENLGERFISVTPIGTVEQFGREFVQYEKVFQAEHYYVMVRGIDHLREIMLKEKYWDLIVSDGELKFVEKDNY